MLSNVYFGRLTYDIVLEEVGEGKKVINNRLAIPINKDNTTFIDIVAWGNTAELLNKYFKKGYELLFQGHLINKTRKKDEVEYIINAILIEKIIFTNGNPKEFNIDLDEIEDFLK